MRQFFGAMLFAAVSAGSAFAQCTFLLNPTSASAPSSGTTGSFAVIGTSGCAWSASSNASWLTVTYGQSGTGSGSVGYRVDASTIYTSRTASITTGGAVFTVTEAGLPCPAATFTPTSQAAPPAGGNYSINITSPCGWNASSNAAWITLASGSGAGNGILSYSVAADNTGTSRSGTIMINGQGFSVLQSGLNCNYTVSPLTVNVGPAGGQNQISVQVSDNSCLWAVQNTTPWISNITVGGKPGTSGTGSGVIGYTVAANSGAQSRTTMISVANQEVTVMQTGNVCNWTLNPVSAEVGFGAGTGSFAVSTSLSNCPWTATTGANWVSLSGTTASSAGTVSYAMTTNTALQPRTATISVNTVPFSLMQDACANAPVFAPQNQTAPAAGGNYNVAVTTVCTWTASSSNSWIAVNAGSGTTGNGTLSYTVAPNNSASQRSGSIAINGQTFTVTQTGITNSSGSVQPQSIVNGASFAAGPVAPGELISIFGTGLGPAQPAGLRTTPDGQSVTTSLAGTEVLFNGQPVPLTYVSALQVNAIVPFEVAGMANVQVVVLAQNVQSSPMIVPIAPTAPGIFAVSGGTGQGAILNQDNSPNSASNPAAAGSVLQIFATGFGLTNPTAADGQIAGATPWIPTATVTAMIGGVNAPVQYVGSSNGLVAGVTQINLLVPGVSPGSAVPVVLNVDGNASASGLTVALH